MEEGIIKFFDSVKGFGFIIQGGDDIFLHVTDIIGDETPKEGDKVQFDIEETPRGLQAKNLQVLN